MGGNAGLRAFARASAPHPVRPGAGPRIRCRFAPHRAHAREARVKRVRRNAQLTRIRFGGRTTGRELETTPMGHPFFFTGHERELGDLVDHPDCRPIERQLRGAACRGMDVDLFHPEDGQADDLVIARCAGCPARLACLALALRAEEPDARAGW